MSTEPKGQRGPTKEATRGQVGTEAQEATLGQVGTEAQEATLGPSEASEDLSLAAYLQRTGELGELPNFERCGVLREGGGARCTLEAGHAADVVHVMGPLNVIDSFDGVELEDGPVDVTSAGALLYYLGERCESLLGQQVLSNAILHVEGWWCEEYERSPLNVFFEDFHTHWV